MDGILSINKPAGFTSFDCVAKIRRISGERKIGHCGTLDPQATGVLTLCLGKATRLLEYMDLGSKTYVCCCRLGYETDTQDIWGTFKSPERAKIDHITRENVLEVLQTLTGEILQKPPVFSAIKVDGRRLYSYAREGAEVEIPVRKVTVHRAELLEWTGPENDFTLQIECSRGTYIRSICSDLGAALGCGAVMSALVRTKAYGISLSECAELSDLLPLAPAQLQERLLPLETAVRNLKRTELTEEQARLFRNGNPLWASAFDPADLEGLRAVFCDGKLAGTQKDGKAAKVLPL